MASSTYETYTIKMINDSDIINTSHNSISNENKGSSKLHNNLDDKSLGVYINGEICTTCNGDKEQCVTGHNGHIATRIPLINPKTTKQLCNFLDSFCSYCYNFRNKDINSLNYQKKSTKPCYHCNKPPIFYFASKKENFVIYSKNEKKSGSKQYIDNLTLYNLYKSFNVEHLMKLPEYKTIGESMFNFTMVILPAPYRVSQTKTNTGANTAVPETNKLYRDIFNEDANIKLQDIHSNNKSVLQAISHKMQEIENKSLYNNKKSNGTDSSLMKTIQGKKGILRNNVIGKKINGAARCVLSCDSEIPFDVILIPRIIASSFKKKVYVNDSNIDRMRLLLLNKKVKSIIQGSSHYNINDTNYKEKTILVGDIVYCEAEENDIVLVNRPPTISTSSIIGMRMWFTDDNTCKINPNSCIYLNADYDGDSLIFYIFEDQIVELHNAHISNHILTNKQDSTVGAFQNTILEVSDLCSIKKIHYTDAIKIIGHTSNFIYKEYYTGHELLSHVIPNSINAKLDSSWDPENKLIIKSGNIIEGIIDKKNAGQNVNGSIFHMMALSNPNKCLKSCYDMQMIGRNWSMLKAFTLTVEDFMLLRSTRLKIQRIKKEKLVDYVYTINNIINGNDKIPIGYTFEEYLNKNIIEKLSFQKDIMEVLNTDIDKHTNNLFKMVLTGSRGKPDNICAMLGMVGLVLSAGNINNQTIENDRNSLHNHNNSFSYDDMGLVLSSLVEGYKVENFLTMTIDSLNAFLNNKTGAVMGGKQNYAMNKVLEGVLTDDTFAYRFNNKRIVQQLINNTGFKLNSLLLINITSFKLNDDEFVKMYGKEFLEEHRNIKKLINISGNNLLDKFKLPINIHKEIEDHMNNNESIINEKFIEEEYENTVNEKVTELLSRIPRVFFNEDRNIPTPRYMSSSMELLAYVLRIELSWKRVKELKIPPTIFNILIGMILQIINAKLLRGVTAAGTTTGYVFSEPITQYSLDSKHRAAGVGSKTSPLDRIKELVNMNKVNANKTPSIFLFPKDNKIDKESIIKSLEEIRLIGLVDNYQILWEQSGSSKLYPKENSKMNTIKEEVYDFCFRYELSKELMDKQNLDLDSITASIETENISLTTQSYEVDNKYVVRIYIRDGLFSVPKNVTFINYLTIYTETIINNILVKGFENVKKVTSHVIEHEVINDDGSVSKIDDVVFVTEGYNQDALFLPWVDKIKSYVDAVPEYCEMFGLYNSREFFAKQLAATINMNPIICLIIADVLTLTGYLTSIKQVGINLREGNNYLMKASLSSTVKNLSDASIKAKETKFVGITDRMFCGEDPLVGPGSVMLTLLNTELHY